ncbi:MAG TPA: hypothetical protein VHE59_11505 [Mucilaginibacter sp.]|nr:hypothetical protein [Mucilaginibacter sp.]
MRKVVAKRVNRDIATSMLITLIGTPVLTVLLYLFMVLMSYLNK